MNKNLDAWTLKLIAIIAMLLNHMVITFWGVIPFSAALINVCYGRYDVSHNGLFCVGGI